MKKTIVIFNKIIIPILIVLSVIPVISFYGYVIIAKMIVYPSPLYNHDPKSLPVSMVYEPILYAFLLGFLLAILLSIFSLIELIINIIKKNKPYFIISRVLIVDVLLFYIVSMIDPWSFLSWFVD
jgi:hypothetical protein